MFFPETLERVGQHWQRRDGSTLALDDARVVWEPHEARLFVGKTLQKSWPLPHDFHRKNDASCSLTRTRHAGEGDVDELALTCDGAHIGISIARAPRIDPGRGRP